MKRRGFLRLIGLLPAGGLLPVLEGAARSRFGNGERIRGWWHKDVFAEAAEYPSITPELLREAMDSLPSRMEWIRRSDQQLMYGDGQGGCLVPECYHKDILAMVNDRSLCLRAHHVMPVITGRLRGRGI